MTNEIVIGTNMRSVKMKYNYYCFIVYYLLYQLPAKALFVKSALRKTQPTDITYISNKADAPTPIPIGLEHPLRF